MGIARSEPCRRLTFSLADWTAEVTALAGGADPLPCPCCERRGFYGPRDNRQTPLLLYRACKFCGFWQHVDAPPNDIIRYECKNGDHFAADWKDPDQSWTCCKCRRTFQPSEAVAWPADDSSHWWRQAPLTGSQSDYRKCFTAWGLASAVSPCGFI
jgi:hypothetical protein